MCRTTWQRPSDDVFPRHTEEIVANANIITTAPNPSFNANLSTRTAPSELGGLGRPSPLTTWCPQDDTDAVSDPNIVIEPFSDVRASVASCWAPSRGGSCAMLCPISAATPIADAASFPKPSPTSVPRLAASAAPLPTGSLEALEGASAAAAEPIKSSMKRRSMLPSTAATSPNVATTSSLPGASTAALPCAKAASTKPSIETSLPSPSSSAAVETKDTMGSVVTVATSEALALSTSAFIWKKLTGPACAAPAGGTARNT
mmetsp:Transcript_14886/g.52217  ORF Transcript_14886/g.52217 Transcript_14886/m.52217 type:complete len:260 (-) Transcript_14886:447-1226(-)